MLIHHVTSDTHFFHRHICQYCPGRLDWCDGTVPDHNEKLIEAWNKVVDPGEVVLHLGDFSFGKVAETRELRKRLNGRIVMALGNHDRGVDGMKNVLQPDDIWGYRILMVRRDGGLVVGRHVPYDFTKIELERAVTCYHGHVHDRAYDDPGENTFLAGVDIFGPRPYGLDDLFLFSVDNDKGNDWAKTRNGARDDL